MPSLRESLDEASDLHVQGFRNIVIALNSSNDFLYVDYDPVGFGTQKALEAIQRNGLYTVVAIFGWGRDRKTAQTILRFRASPGFRTKESQESIVWEFRRQQCVAEVMKKEEKEDAANYR